ncbi:MAG TPA: substrate-binding domain-containing protein [Pyrinomonadaceae bacterium]|jgi:mxaJ protein|nr:substrate-binding domain-containing protein [Pyrinomonadaceae bacterium]
MMRAALFGLALAASFSSCAKQSKLTGTAQSSQQSQTPQQQPHQQSEQVLQTKSPRETRVLRVCADPNNMPFSNERGEGFENRIVETIAKDLGARVEYTWWAQRRGFFRSTLRAGLCDLVAGVPSSFELAQTTSPYYRSTYVFVYRKGGGVDVHSFDDPALKNLKIGVQMIGDDFANTPPAHALTNRHITNVRGYMVYGDYSKPSPSANIIEAVERGEVDVAVVWGPLAGYFAKRHAGLEVVPVSPQIDLPFLPFVYDISMGVRRGDNLFRDEIEGAIERRRAEIEKILDEYGVPRVNATGAADSTNANNAGVASSPKEGGV